MYNMRFMKLIVGLLALLLSVSLSLALAAEAEKDKSQGVQKTTTNDNYNWFTINNIFNWYGNNGNSSYNISTANDGLEFPKGSGNGSIFEDGVLWGGFHKGRVDPKVGGSAYNYGLQAGVITGDGGPLEAQRPTFDDPTLAKYRVYKVRPDVTPTTVYAKVQAAMEAEAALINRYSAMTGPTLFANYQRDWNEWPAKDGLPAPYNDVNKNGKYDPTLDIPGQPGADQTLYYVANDLNATRTTNLYFSPPIGLEMHRTVWGYNLPGALGNTIFASTLIINRSGASLDSAYFVQWSDPDLGDAGDDFAGCDVGRSLGFIYNGHNVDLTYGSAVPAAGYDFFQGPIVKTGNNADSAVFRLKYRKGYKNLGMTTFDFFINGSTTYTDPPRGTSGGDVQWYRLMNALIAPSGSPFIDPTTKLPSKFTLNGDPLSGKGWLDGTFGLVPGDRRICLVTGPFTLANKDTQELVVATIVGLGGDRISSIAVLKFYDDLAQSAYNNLFNIPRPPPTPEVTYAALEGEISISWPDSVGPTKIESWNSSGYAFEGYNVYQFPSTAADVSNAVRLATYDLVNSVTTIFDDLYDAGTGYVVSKPAQFGTDSGIKRRFITKTDAIGRRALVNGSRYYFGVTAYSFNGSPTAKPAQLESPALVTAVVPQWPDPGVRYYAAAGDTIRASATGALSEGLVIPIVVDPKKITGHTYKVTFHNDASGNLQWDLTDVATGVVKVKNQTNQSGDENYPIVDGMLVKVTGPPVGGMKAWLIPSGTRRFSPVGGFTGLGLEGFSTGGDPNAPADPAAGTIGAAGNFAFGGITTSLTFADYRNVLLKLAVVDNVNLWNPLVTPTDANYSKAYRYVRNVGTATAPADPSFAPWIINKGAGYPYQDYNYGVPFSAWNTETTPPTRLSVGMFENNVVGGLIDGRYWPGLTTGDNTVAREFCFIFATPYSTTADPALTINLSNSKTPMMWVMTCARRAEAAWVAADQFQIIASHLNSPGTVFTFTPATPAIGDQTLAAADVDRVNVFPNPYIGFNPQEANKYQRFVTFTHMPRAAVVRIFNLAGVLVRTLKKDDPTQFFQWDLRNESGFPVGAGMYIAYIDMPDVGKTKTLKLGIIPEQQFIDKW